MNNKNALGFLVLGVLMYSTPVMAESISGSMVSTSDISVRAVWLELMGWINGGIGLTYLMKEGVIRLPAWIAAITPERFLRPIEARGELVQLPAGARVSASS
jgi:hypothetical protein